MTVYYAAEHVHSSLADMVYTHHAVQDMLATGIDVLKQCKHAAMQKCLRNICSRRHLRLNVVSVGDSTVEQKAIKSSCSPRTS